MQSGTCPKCGAPLTPGATFCSFCGSPVALSGTPLAGAANAPPQFPPPPSTGYATPPPPRRSRARTVILVIVVVIVIIIAVVAVAYLLFPAPPVQVQAINIWAPDNVCGLNSNPIYYDGYNSSTGAVQTLDFGIPNFNATGCTVVDVTTNSSGFSISDVQVPLSIPGGGTGSMNITITSPSSAFTGSMNLVFA